MGLPADAGVFVAAEGGAGGDLVVCIDPHTAGLDVPGHPEGTIQVLGQDSAAQLQGSGDQAIRSGLGDVPAYLGGAGEGQLPEAGMLPSEAGTKESSIYNP